MATRKAAQEAVQRYKKKNYDRILVLLPKGERERVKAYAKAHGHSVNTLIQELLKREILNEATWSINCIIFKRN